MASAGPDKKCPERMLVCHDAGGVPSAKKQKRKRKEKRYSGSCKALFLHILTCQHVVGSAAKGRHGSQTGLITIWDARARRGFRELVETKLARIGEGQDRSKHIHTHPFFFSRHSASHTSPPLRLTHHAYPYAPHTPCHPGWRARSPASHGVDQQGFATRHPGSRKADLSYIRFLP